MTLISKLKSYVETLIEKYSLYSTLWNNLRSGYQIAVKDLPEEDGVNVFEAPSALTKISDAFYGSGTSSSSGSSSSSSTLLVRKSKGSALNSFEQTGNTVKPAQPTIIDLSELDQSKLTVLQLSGFQNVVTLNGFSPSATLVANCMGVEDYAETMFPPDIADIEFVGDLISSTYSCYELFLYAYTSLSEGTMTSLLNAIEDLGEDAGNLIYLSSATYALIEDTDLPDSFLAKGWELCDYDAKFGTSTTSDEEA